MKMATALREKWAMGEVAAPYHPGAVAPAQGSGATNSSPGFARAPALRPPFEGRPWGLDVI